MRKAVAAAFGSALLAAGTGVVTQSHAAHGVLSTNTTGKAVNHNAASGGTASATCDVCTQSLESDFSATKVAGVHANGNHNKQKMKTHTAGGQANGSNHGSAKSGGQSFRVK